jgi:carbonic anhydrase
MKNSVVPALIGMLLSIACGQNNHAKETHGPGNVSHENLTAEEVLAKLKAGNQNFKQEIATRNLSHGQLYNYLDQVDESKSDQHPIAFILSCIDSRVPPEIIFDQGIGQLFVGRVAGNVEDQFILGSMEYAVNIKGVKLIVVLGHTNCGAIHAAFEHLAASNGSLLPLVDHVKQGIIPADSEPYVASARHNVVLTIQHILKNSQTIRTKMQAHQLMIAGGLYDVATGTVDWNTSGW